MSLNRWLSVILMLGLILALSPLGAQAEPYESYYHHPHGHAYGWDGPRHRGYERECYRPHHPRPQVYAVQPPVAYVTPVAPIIGYQACPQPQPYYSQPATPGLSSTLQYNF